MSCLQIFLSELHSWEWLGILLARVAVGLLFFLSGRSKLFVPQRREQMRQQLNEAHVPFPEFNAVLVSAVEFGCGLLLILGALTPLACALLACVMITAITTTAIRNVFRGLSHVTRIFNRSYSVNFCAGWTARSGTSPFGNRHARC